MHASTRRLSVRAGEPVHDPAAARWSLRFQLRPIAAVDDLRRAPAVEAAGIVPQSIWRHSHIRLDRERLERARTLVEEAAAARL